MTQRRERVTITAHSDQPGIDAITVDGALETFRVDTRDDYVPGPGGRLVKQAGTSEVRVTLVMYLDPETARIFRDRKKRKPTQRLITQPERDFHTSLRHVQLLAILDDETYESITGRIPPSRRIVSCTTCQGTHIVLRPIQHYDYVTPEMAFDAGEPTMIGMQIDGGIEWVQADCPECTTTED